MPVNFKGIKTTNDRPYDAEMISRINDSLAYLPIRKRAYILGTMIEESQGDPLATSESGKYHGLLQWGADRYQMQSNDREKELTRQMQQKVHHINDTTDRTNWTHGGEKSGYNSFREAYNDYNNPSVPFDQGYRAFSFGYVRPQGKDASVRNRLKVVHQVYNRLLFGEALPSSSSIEKPDATRVSRPVTPVHRKDEGGKLGGHRQWDDLSLREMSDIMAVAVRHGLTSLKDIKDKWNEFAEGGYMDDDNPNELPEVEVVAQYPHEQRVIDTMNASNAEFMRRLRNNDRRSIANDDGSYSTHVLGSADNIVFPQIQDVNGKLVDYRSMPWESAMRMAIDNGDYIAFPTEGDARYFGEHYKKYFPNFFGGDSFKTGGYMPSSSIKRNIALWEGDSMKTNRPFEAEAKDFNRVIPQSVRDNLSQDQLDALYSYGYNVGMGNLKKRVLPTLQAYINGNATPQDVADHMWASKDKELRGLRRRRAWERDLFTGNSTLLDERQRAKGLPNSALYTSSPNGDSPISDILPMGFYPPNPTDYVVPVDYSAPSRETETIYPRERNNLALLSFMESLGLLDSPKKQQPLSSYTPSRGMFTVNAPSHNSDTLLDDSWFANGGRLYAPRGVMDNNNGQAINHEFTYDNPFEYMGNTYPTSRMIVDGVERQVFAGGDGTVWAIGDNNLPYKVLYQHELPEVVVKPSAEDTLKRRQKDYLTMSNDATAVANGQSLNPHLNERGIQGAMAHAAWDKEHPNLAAWRDVATAVPFAVAVYPFAAGLGDMAAATSVSQGLTNIMNMAATTAKNATWLPWADAAISAPFAAHGVTEMSQGNFTPETAMEVAPVAQIFRPLTYSTKLRNPSRVAKASSKPFASELDWSPESWFDTRAKGVYDAEDVMSLQSHVPEYLTIEQKAKADGTWLRMPDGAIWEGDPRSWVQMQSLAYKKAGMTGTPHYSGIDLKSHPISYTPEYNGDSWTDLNQGMSKNWSGIGTQGHEGYIFQLDYPSSSKELIVEAKGRNWNDLPTQIFLEKPGIYNKTTDDLVEQSARHGYDVTKINDVVEGFSDGKPVTDVVIHAGTPRKSLIGNNGNFDMTNPNIYKGIIYPLGIGWTLNNFLIDNR